MANVRRCFWRADSPERSPRGAASVWFCLLVVALVSLAWPPASSAAGRAKTPAVTLHASARVVSPGARLRFSGRVSPRPGARARLVLQMRLSGNWRTVASARLKGATFSVTERAAGVGGQLWRVVESAGRSQTMSATLIVTVRGQRTVRSVGRALHLQLGAVSVSAPKGAIRKGETLTVSVAVGAVSPGSSVSGGPYQISTSQREPAKPVSVSVTYDQGLLSKGSHPLFLHRLAHPAVWVGERTTTDSAHRIVTAQLGSFSWFEVLDSGQYYAGLIVGNRADLPSDCGSAPSWISSGLANADKRDAVPACFYKYESGNASYAYLQLVNNRGYAQLLTVSGLKPDLGRTRFGGLGDVGTIETAFATALAVTTPAGGQDAFVLAPGGTVTLVFDHPPQQGADRQVEIDASPQTVGAAGEAVWELFSAKFDEIGTPVGLLDCFGTALHNGLSKNLSRSGLIDELRNCSDNAPSFVKLTKSVSDAITGLGVALLADGLIGKVSDLIADEQFPPQIGFTIPGAPPELRDLSIHLNGATLGTIPSGERTTAQLSATGGTPPYSYGFTDLDQVPSWMTLGTDGTLRILPPACDLARYRVYAYVTDATGHHSPTDRDAITFDTAPPSGASVINPGDQTATVGMPVYVPIRGVDCATGGALTYSATGLPAGLQINSSTGVITGTPTAAGTANVTVTAADPGGQSGSATFNWTVAPSGGALALDTHKVGALDPSTDALSGSPVAIGPNLFFATYGGWDGVDYTWKLWSSNGNGIFPVKSGTGFLWDLARANNTLYFTVSTVGGWQLWKSDGTSSGTTMVSTLAPVTIHNSTGNGYGALTSAGNGVFFTYCDISYCSDGYELWYSDGTAAGTRLVRNFDDLNWYDGTDGVTLFGVVNGKLLFSTWPYDSPDDQLWVSDGTYAGTYTLGDVGEARAPLIIMNGVGYFTQNGSDSGLWRTDGTPAGTYPVRSGVGPLPVAAVGSTLYLLDSTYAADGHVVRTDLYASDGTGTAPTLVTSWPDGVGYLDTVAGKLLLVEQTPAANGNDETLWASDGTATSTVQVAPLGQNVGLSPYQVADGLAFFSPGNVLWYTDGTAADTGAVGGAPTTADVTAMTAADGSLYYFTPDESLWQTKRSPG